MNGENGGMETYLTIEEVAAYLKLAQQTIRKYVLNKTIPYRKVQKSVRFRLSEIEKWIDEGGGNHPDYPVDGRGADLFACLDATETGEAEPEAGAMEPKTESDADGQTGGTGEAETGADGQSEGTAAEENGEVKA
jgi:excisionase family DNA binding protein